MRRATSKEFSLISSLTCPKVKPNTLEECDG
jgi:hypothetical protein